MTPKLKKAVEKILDLNFVALNITITVQSKYSA